MLRKANRDDRSGDLLGKLKADARVTTQTRKKSAASALRILFVTEVWSFPAGDLHVEQKKAARCHRG